MGTEAGDCPRPPREEERRPVSLSKLLKLECVIGENTGEASLESRAILHQRARKIADIHARLVDLSADVVDGQVMVQGILHKQIFFVGEDDRIRHQCEDTPFCIFVEVPGAQMGQNAHVQGSIAKVTYSLERQIELVQRAILQFFVKVTEDCQLNVALDPKGPLVKAEQVIGEATQAQPVESVSDLERPAVKIRDIRVFVENVAAEPADGQVLFQGTLVQNIFYIGTNDQEYFQEERVPFSGIVDVAGATPESNVDVDVRIARVDRFLTNGSQVRQRVLLSVFVKVTETTEVCVSLADRGTLVLLHKLVATGNRQVLIENIGEFNLPAQKVQDITARVQDIVTEVICNKVLIQGTLHKQIFYVADDDIVHHQGEDVAFSTFVDLPGAQPWMKAQVIPRIEHVGWHLTDQVAGEPGARPVSEVCAHHEVPLFCQLIQKTVIDLHVRLSEDAQLRVLATPQRLGSETSFTA